MEGTQETDLANLRVEESITQLSPEQLTLLKRVHVCMPWGILLQYLETILRFEMNIEIGFEAHDLDRYSRRDFRAAADHLLASSCAVTLHGPFWDLHPGSSDQLVRQLAAFRIHQFMDIIDIFQPLQVVCHTGYDPRHHGGLQRSWVDRSAEFWEPVVRRAEDRHAAILLENVWEHNPEFHIQLLQKIDSPSFGFCLDVGHQHAFSRTPVAEWVKVLGKHLGEVHLHDNDGNHDSHLPIGWGKIDFRALFVLLKERAIRPLLTLEPHKGEHLGPSVKGLGAVMKSNGLEYL